MSLDDAIAIAGVSGSDPMLLTVGLVLSIAAILVCSGVILVVVDRFRWVVYAGTGILAPTAAGIMVHDLEAIRRGTRSSGPVLPLPLWIDWGFRATVVGACLTSSRWWPGCLARVEPA